MNYFHIKSTDKNIKVISFNNKDDDENFFTKENLIELHELLCDISKDKTVKGIVFKSGKSDTFITGTFLSTSPQNTPKKELKKNIIFIQKIFNKLSKFKITTVAAINGECSANGLEFALCFKWRIASNSHLTNFHMPQIKYGLIPNAGGTYRLLKLIGAKKCLDLLLNASILKANEAFQLNIIDDIVRPEELETIAIKYAEQNISKKVSFIKKIYKHFKENNHIAINKIYKDFHKKIYSQYIRFNPASFRILSAVIAGAKYKSALSLRLELKYFIELLKTRERESLLHLFDCCSYIKNRYVIKNNRSNIISIIGFSDIAKSLIKSSIDHQKTIYIAPIDNKELNLFKNFIDKYINSLQKSRLIKSYQAKDIFKQIFYKTSYSSIKDSDLIFDCSRRTQKEKILTLLTAHRHTSVLTILRSSQNLQTLNSKANIIKANYLPLDKIFLEIIGNNSSNIDPFMGVLNDFKIRFIYVKDNSGGYIHRLFGVFLNEAINILSNKTEINKIDQGLFDFGFKYPPFILADKIGIKTCLYILNNLPELDKSNATKGLKKMIDQNFFGHNSGFYTHKGDKTLINEIVYYIFTKYKFLNKHITNDEIVNRCVLIVLNEAAHCLEKGIIASPCEGDYGAVYGLGFPEMWGGPFKYMDHVGISAIISQLQHLKLELGQRFSPAPILLKYADRKKSFYSKIQ